jgi:hypothetical protein
MNLPAPLSKDQLLKLSQEDRTIYALCWEMVSKKTNPQSKEYQNKYYFDPYRWVVDFVDMELAKYHGDVLRMVKLGHSKIAVVGPHGLGKSVLAAIIILWAGSVSTDCKIPTTASAWRQLEEYLWPEVHKWYSKVDWDAVEKAGGGKKPRLLTLECQFSDQSKAFAVASDNPETIEGAHAKRIVYLFDESKAIPAGTWESAEGAFSTPGDHLQFAFSTPGDASGVFYSICSRQKGYEKWKVRHVTLREAIRAKRITLEWAREKRAAWGKDNPVYQNRVWGIFAKDADDAVIPLSWINMAVARWHAWISGGRGPEGKFIIGADTAGRGVDKTSIMHRIGNTITKIVRYKKSQPMELAGKLKNDMGPKALLNIDVSYGEGAGTAYRLSEFEGFQHRINFVNFSTRTDKTDRTGSVTFANVRALMWWNMREMLDPENKEDIALPDDELLIGDLVAVRRMPMRSDGKLLIESKEDIKARIGRSTDDGDACCLAFYLDHYEGTRDTYDMSALSKL